MNKGEEHEARRRDVTTTVENISLSARPIRCSHISNSTNEMALNPRLQIGEESEIESERVRGPGASGRSRRTRGSSTRTAAEVFIERWDKPC